MLSLTKEASKRGITSFSRCIATEIPRTANTSASSSAAFEDSRETPTKAWLSGSQNHWTVHDAYQGDSVHSLRQQDRAPLRRPNSPGPYVVRRGRSIRVELQNCAQPLRPASRSSRPTRPAARSAAVFLPLSHESSVRLLDQQTRPKVARSEPALMPTTQAVGRHLRIPARPLSGGPEGSKRRSLQPIPPPNAVACQRTSHASSQSGNPCVRFLPKSLPSKPVFSHPEGAAKPPIQLFSN